MDYAALKAENSRQLREDWRERREVFRAMPELVRLNHSNVCNLRCVTCWHHLGVPSFGISMKLVERIAHEVFPTAQKVILTSSGEPLLAQFDEILELTVRYQTKIEMYTSCLNMTEKRWARMYPVLDTLHVSIDCPEKNGYERVRLGSSYERVVDNLAMIKRWIDERGKPFSYHCQGALLKSTVKHLPEFVRFASDYGFDLLHVQRVFKTHEGLDGEDILTQMPRAELDALVNEASDEARRLDFTLIVEELGYPNVMATRQPRWGEPQLMSYGQDGVCWFAGQSIDVNHAGECSACCFPTDMYLGDATRQPIREIWNGRAMRKLRRQFHTGRLNPFCRDCLLVTRNPTNERSINFYRRHARLKYFNFRKDLGKRLRSTWDKLAHRQDNQA